MSQQLHLPRDISSIAFGQNVLLEGLQIVPGQYLASNTGLYGDIELLPGQFRLQFEHHGLSSLPHLTDVAEIKLKVHNSFVCSQLKLQIPNSGQLLNLLPIEQHVQSYQL